MKDLLFYFSDKEIITLLCKLRVKIATSRSKKHRTHLLTKSPKYNYHNNKYLTEKLSSGNLNKFEEYNIELENTLNSILPPRRKWVKVGKDIRFNDGQLISTSDKNLVSLIKTIKIYRGKEAKENWVKALDSFLNNIRDCISDPNYIINTPIIYPKPKSDKKNAVIECRPIAIYSLIDRIILSITNKYLTKLFDKYFYNCSFAFRNKRDLVTGRKISHHDCIYEILKMRTNSSENLFVVECDIEKFYDSVDHKVVLPLFDKLLDCAKSEYPDLNFDPVHRIFHCYLKSYAFNVNVPKRNDASYWRSFGINDGEFGWISSSLEKLNYYSDITTERIGVPQGGALSGLLANIVLNEADRNLTFLDSHYFRFCDDMIIIHPEIEACIRGRDIYDKELRRLKLIPHSYTFDSQNDVYPDMTFSGIRRTLKTFWDSKSKGPFLWSHVENNGIPWIGFVGYEIKFNGDIRVRKKSLLKEIGKQKTIQKKNMQLIKSGPRKSKRSFIESAISKMIGMSVGKVTLRNYKVEKSDKCWKQGFKALNKNYYSGIQMRQLDRSRNKYFQSIMTFVSEMDWPELKYRKQRNRQIIKYNKPFSYFYQVLEKNKSA